MNLKRATTLAFILGSFSACHKESTDSQPATATSAPAVLTNDALDKATVPVKEDYEEKARQTITEDTLDDRLDQLEKQIKADH
jgi:hypothetical protein